MPTSTYVALQTTTLGATASSVTFSSIPGTYRDLVLVLQSKTSVEAYPRLRFNSDSGSNYIRVGMAVNSGSPESFSGTVSFISLSGYASANSNDNYNAIAQIMDYSVTDKHKTVLARANNAALSTDAIATRWANTAAVTSIEVSLDTGTFASGSTFSLYGIEA